MATESNATQTLIAQMRNGIERLSGEWEEKIAALMAQSPSVADGCQNPNCSVNCVTCSSGCQHGPSALAQSN
jgi:hypothetical protein